MQTMIVRDILTKAILLYLSSDIQSSSAFNSPLSIQRLQQQQLQQHRNGNHHYTTSRYTILHSKSLLEEAEELKRQAQKARLEAEKMDEILRLQKIEALEKKVKDTKMDQAGRADLASQLEVLKNKGLPQQSNISSPMTTNTAAEKPASTMIKEDSDSSTAEAPIIQKTNIEIESQTPDPFSSSSSSSSSLERATEEEIKEAIEAFDKLPSLIQDMIAKSVDLESGQNSTEVIYKLDESGRLLEGGVDGFEIELDSFDMLAEDLEFAEIATYVEALLPKRTRKINGYVPSEADMDLVYTQVLTSKTFNPTGKVRK